MHWGFFPGTRANKMKIFPLPVCLGGGKFLCVEKRTNGKAAFSQKSLEDMC